MPWGRWGEGHPLRETLGVEDYLVKEGDRYGEVVFQMGGSIALKGYDFSLH